MKLFFSCAALILLASIAVRPCAAAWSPQAVPICAVPGDVAQVEFGSDGVGGAFAVWMDSRNLGIGPARLFAQHITATGDLATGWPANGVRVGATDEWQADPVFVPAGDGGLFVAWIQIVACPYGCGGPRVRLLRLAADGTVASGWPSGGMDVATVPVGSTQGAPALASDQSGGVIVTWVQSDGTRGEVRAQRVRDDGSRVWPGSSLGSLVISSSGSSPVLSSDDRGGAYVAWRASIPYGRHATGIVGQHLDASGTNFWDAGGDTIAVGPGDRAALQIVPDGSGNAALAWLEVRDDYCCYGSDLYMQMLHPDRPGCSTCANVALAEGSDQSNARIAADGTGGVYAVWEDDRFGAGGVYAQRMDGALTPATGWPRGGLPVCTMAGSTHRAPVIASDGAVGATVAWSDDRLQPGLQLAYATRLASDGTWVAGWPHDGVLLCPLFAPQIMLGIAPSPGGAIALWLDFRSSLTGPPAAYDALDDLYAQRVTLPPPPTLSHVALADTLVTPRRVRLGWATTAGVVGMAAVERRTPTGDWSALRWILSDAAGRFAYDDSTVVPEQRYGYRLAIYPDDGSQRFEGEVWVTVPALSGMPIPARLALRASGAMPARDLIGVTFELPDATPARLELIDPAGRIIETREIASLGPGAHAVSLGSQRRLPAGIYLVRLTQHEHAVTMRACLLR